MEDVTPPSQPRRRGIWFAVVVSAAALPLLLIDNLTADADGDAIVPVTARPVVTVVVPVDRPATGPPKGISVVTSSTTSSTRPIATPVKRPPPTQVTPEP